MVAAQQHLGDQGLADAMATVLLQDEQVRQLQRVEPRQFAALDQQESGDEAIHQHQVGAPLRLLPVARQVLLVDIEAAVHLHVLILPVRRLVGVVLVEIADQIGLLGPGLHQLDGGVSHGRTSHRQGRARKVSAIEGMGISMTATGLGTGRLSHKRRRNLNNPDIGKILAPLFHPGL
ncbi:hypothetical protein FQZ97_848230 [compost metagenome]